MMGRHAKPVDLQLVDGNKNKMTKEEIDKRKKAEEAINFKSDKVKPPTWLSDDAKKVFRKLVKEYEHNEMLVNVDVHALAMFSDAYINYIQCCEIIDKEGLMIEQTNKAGATNSVPHPLLTKKKQLFEQLNKIMGEFGLSPSSRAKLAIPSQIEKVNDKLSLFGDNL